MPELPEVESTRRYLEPVLVGARISNVEVRRARMVRRQENPADFGARLGGRRVLALERLGKFMLARLEGDITWVTHLGMSGRLQVADSDESEDPHTNVVVDLENGPQIRFVDPRTFGFMVAYTPAELERSTLARLGRDALEDLPRSSELARLLERRSAPIKALLLDQRLISGLGNIYADEVLHRAAVSPHRPGGSLSPDEIKSLRAAIRPILKAGLAAGGTSLSDLAYLLPDGRAGDYLARLQVYGRTGESCKRCGATIEAVVLRGRTTHWCPGCQL
jgi:formamidopyrimidine-DNA glycosylase